MGVEKHGREGAFEACGIEACLREGFRRFYPNEIVVSSGHRSRLRPNMNFLFFAMLTLCRTVAS